MSIWTNLLSWALSAAKNESQTIGIKALQDAAGQLNTVVSQHAPDMAPMINPLMQQLTSNIVAGIMTKTH